MTAPTTPSAWEAQGFDDAYSWVTALRRLDRGLEALPALEAHLASNPDDAVTWLALGVCLYDARQPLEAIVAFDRTIALGLPALAVRAAFRWLALRAAGRFAEAFADFECRLEVESYAGAAYAEALHRLARRPRWDGSPLEGRTILLHGEQGFGDMMQMARFVPLVRQCGAGRITLEVPETLVRLFADCGADEVIAAPAAGGGADHEVVASLLSLPHLVGPEPPPPARLWTARRPISRGGFRCGVCWTTARPDEIGDPGPALRALPVTWLRPFFTLSDIEFVNMQVGPRAAELPAEWDGHRIERIDESVRDFADTGAVVRELDAVVTVDAAMAHVSASLGVPTLVLLRHCPDPRWGLSGSTSPWYPTVKLFRQPAPGDWPPAVLEARSELQRLRDHARHP